MGFEQPKFEQPKTEKEPEISKEETEVLEASKIIEEVESKLVDMGNIPDEEFSKISEEIDKLSQMKFADDEEYYKAKEQLQMEYEKSPMNFTDFKKEKAELFGKIDGTTRGRLDNVRNILETAKEHREEKPEKEAGLAVKEEQEKEEKEKIEGVRAELQEVESKEAEPKISMEERIAELERQREEIDKQIDKVYKEKGPSLRTLKGWKEFFTGEQFFAKIEDLRAKSHTIFEVQKEMEARLSFYSELKKGRILDSLTVEELQKRAKMKADLSDFINTFKDKESGDIYGNKLTLEVLKAIERKLQIDDVATFETERAEEIKEASRKLSHQFEAQDIGKGMKVRLDNGQEGWVRRFNREEGILELWDNPAFTRPSRYDVRDIKSVQTIEESKSEKAKRKLSALY